MICPNCGTDNRPGARFCAKCGASLVAETVAWTPPSPADSLYPSTPPQSPASSFPPPPPGPAQTEKRYPFLRAMSVIYKVLGGITAGLTLIGVLFSCIAGFTSGSAFEELGDLGLIPGVAGAIGGLITGFFVLLYGGFIAITLFGVGDMIDLSLSIEENIRSMAQR